LGLMVSGGGDSVALLHLMSKAQRDLGLDRISVVTVDHGLREAAGLECALVEKLCQDLGLSCTRLEWTDHPTTGNLQALARNARYQLVEHWAKDNDIDTIATGHTRTDQAETFLMRLARGSGVDGLTAMPRANDRHGLRLIRPLLGFSRQELRAFLKTQDVEWIDDPSNVDDQFLRVQFRNALPMLGELGLTEERLAETALHMERAKAALEAAERSLSAEIATATKLGSVILESGGFFAAPEEIRTRAFVRALNWITGGHYKPRYSALSDALQQLRLGKRTTLHGCLCVPVGPHIHIMREPNAVSPEMVSGIWDNRWNFPDETMEIVQIGENLTEIFAHWRDEGLPREVWLSLPAYLDNGHLRSFDIQDTSSDGVCSLKRSVDRYLE